MKTILAPTNFSALSLNAVNYAADLARIIGARLYHVFSTPTGNFAGWTQFGNTGATGVTSNSQYVHSGTFGGSIYNPGQALADLIAGMHDKKGKITLPGFYDKVRKLTGKERRQLAKLPYDEATWLGITGAPGLHGEKGYSTVERVGARLVTTAYVPKNKAE